MSKAKKPKSGQVIWVKDAELVQELKQITSKEPGAKLYEVTERLLRKGIEAEAKEAAAIL